ncbi:glycoside hydrolase family 104 protein [Ochrobactrum sp. MC-1LL]|uniref:glycoside hydrolase family 104 protein n=1 Tax=Ochrobactrum sp. MC-1LL TaxID=2735351 RepID=UPI00143858F6|nr:glycoside hydrolase family 104 protein [Ochrobactrum sp. MC-1LL]NKE77528.1 glycoside hydrolase family 104 protein [Ochrobactrum sp. MC-1LL]
MDKTVPAGAALLLDFIGDIEAPRGYDTIYGNNQDKLPKPITKMTLGELIDAQASFTKRFKSSASGRYQFMRATLQDLSKELGLRGTQVFDADLQDRLGYHLLKRRGYDQFIAGKISRTEFGKRLAQEWASLPVLAATKGAHRNLVRGQSYYAGDALNKSLVTPAKVEAVLNKVKTAGSAQPFVSEPEVVVVEKPVVADPGELEQHPAKSKTVWTWALAGIGAAVTAVGDFLGGLDWRVQLFISMAIVAFAIYGIKRRNDLFKAVKDLKAQVE